MSPASVRGFVAAHSVWDPGAEPWGPSPRRAGHVAAKRYRWVGNANNAGLGRPLGGPHHPPRPALPHPRAGARPRPGGEHGSTVRTRMDSGRSPVERVELV